MPQLSEITYSRDACVAAVRDYYAFLVQMYLNASDVVEPPEGGWPNITPDNLKDLGKTEEVVSLLRHLPYIRAPQERAQGAPWCYFADWESKCLSLTLGRDTGDDLRVTSESASFYQDVPAHVVGLTSGGRDNPVFLLDTELGVVYWPECPGEIRYHPSRERVEDDPYDYAAENEADWRADGGAWAVADFFEVLKDQFRELCYVPISPRIVWDVYTTFGPGTEGMLDMLKDVYREYGWPDLKRYQKRECLEAVYRALEERYPGNSDGRDYD